MCFLFLNSSIFFLKLWFSEKILPLNKTFFSKKKNLEKTEKKTFELKKPPFDIETHYLK